MRVLIVALLMAISINAQANGEPGGAINPAVTQINIKQTICKPNWVKSVRPSSYQTNKIKRKQLKRLNLKDDLSLYEEDHLISLQLGGSPGDENNLWPQPYAGNCGARVKDIIEGKLKRLICTKKITLETAQREIATDWVAAYNKHIGELVCQK